MPSVNTNQSTNDKVEVNINTGDKSEIEKLPGIGPSKADAILHYRETNGEFKTVDDLKKVKGFGDKTVESLKDFIVLN
ncbi:ComEA family DNA-binding protein [Mammaliicoccus sciuri]|uniref:ComEA family DNA-binding protein n=1 Tax=Mammaliicoccus sciuri TaxID=1296 RepID=UPI002DB5BB49|nr:helix-hairpin-helix domain-containing protein [Mammaliicoccus sciuri]MEB6338528.1 helix-hairpin-helix domain-containing protein [Mammaliicoccus sciuri]